MTDQDLTGKWTGEYVYGDVYKAPIKGITVAFELEMTVTSGIVKGNCTDDEFRHHFKSPATIEGVVKENTITFVKKYPCMFNIDDDGKITLFPKLPSHEIHYSGHYADGKFSGAWKVTLPYAAEDDTDVFDARQGEWQMQKV